MSNSDWWTQRIKSYNERKLQLEIRAQAYRVFFEILLMTVILIGFTAMIINFLKGY